MAACRDNSKAVKPFMPSLEHFASVKVAVSMLEKFGVETLEEAYTEIQVGSPTPSEENGTRHTAQESLLYIPAHLRRRVMQAAHGSADAVSRWTMWHVKFDEEKRSLHRRSDGSIDFVETAVNLIKDEKLDIKDRFELACSYFLEDWVQALWAEMEKVGGTEHFTSWFAAMKPEVSFWIGWLRDRSRGSWTKYLGRWVQEIPREFGVPSVLALRCSTFFSVLRPEERRQCFDLLGVIPSDDLRFCHYALTKDEEEQVLLLTDGTLRLLSLHLEWPLQALFLETAKKLWKHVDVSCFSSLLAHILNLNDGWTDFNYSELFEEFWKASPLHLRESARAEKCLRRRIDSFFDEKQRKRKCIDNSRIRKI